MCIKEHGLEETHPLALNLSTDSIFEDRFLTKILRFDCKNMEKTFKDAVLKGAVLSELLTAQYRNRTGSRCGCEKRPLKQHKHLFAGICSWGGVQTADPTKIKVVSSHCFPLKCGGHTCTDSPLHCYEQLQCSVCKLCFRNIHRFHSYFVNLDPEMIVLIHIMAQK